MAESWTAGIILMALIIGVTTLFSYLVVKRLREQDAEEYLRSTEQELADRRSGKVDV
jgi:membrane protein implicated in regulation of membrane protease activity